MTTAGLITEQQLADLLQMDVEDVVKFRRRHRWPHLKFGRFKIRYTPAQVEQIQAIHAVRISPKSGPVVEGQTAASRSRTA